MKTLRYRIGNEVKPGILDHEGNIRDVSSLVKDWDNKNVTVDKLNEADVCADALTVYDSVQAPRFTDEFMRILKAGDVQAVTFYSRRTAEAFVSCVRESESESLLARIKVLSISDAVLECVRVLPWLTAYTAKSPDRQGMRELLETHITR